MGRYCKCPRACAEGQSCIWKSKMLEQVPLIKRPYFLRCLCEVMLWSPKNRYPRLEIPSQFVQEHGDKFGEVVQIQGPCGKVSTIRVRIQRAAYNRVSFDSGWTAFVTSSNMVKGDHVIFALDGFSRFTVYIFDKLGTLKQPSNLDKGSKMLFKHAVLQKREERKSACRFSESHRDNPEEMRQSKDTLPVRKHSENPRELNSIEETERSADRKDPGSPEASQSNPFSDFEMFITEPVVLEISDDDSTEANSDKRHINAGKDGEITSEEANNSRQWEEAKKNKSFGSLQFVKKLPLISLKHRGFVNCTHLEVPSGFVQRHIGLFKEEMYLQGPSGRVWSVACLVFPANRFRRVQLKAGWGDFAEDNMFKKGNRLRFTHTGPATFVVQVIPRTRKKEMFSWSTPLHDKIQQTTGDENGKEKLGVSRRGPTERGSHVELFGNTKRRMTWGEACRLKYQMANKNLVQRHVETNHIGRKRGRMEWGLAHT